MLEKITRYGLLATGVLAVISSMPSVSMAQAVANYDIVSVFRRDTNGTPHFTFGAIRIDRKNDKIASCGASMMKFNGEGITAYCRTLKAPIDLENAKIATNLNVQESKASMTDFWTVDVVTGQTSFCIFYNKIICAVAYEQ